MLTRYPCGFDYRQFEHTIFKHIGLTETGIEGLGLYKEVRFFHSQFQQCV